MRKSLLKQFRFASCLLSAVIVIACTKSPALSVEGEATPVPGSAYDIQRYLVELDSFYQIDFKTDVPYPETKTAKFYSQYFTNKGWHVCSGKDARNDWEIFEIRTDAQSNRPTRQLLQYFASKKDGKLALLSLRYYGVQQTSSLKQKDCIAETEWNDNVQHVSVMLYDLKEDYEKGLSFLSLNCKEQIP